MKLDQELLPLEADFPDLCPREAVDLGHVLEDEDAGVGDGEVQGNAVMVLEKN